MSFLSFEWLTWLVATVSLYWLNPAWVRSHVLTAIGAAFLFVHSPTSLAVLVFISCVTYFGTLGTEMSGRRTLLVVGLVVAILAYFKISVHTADTLTERTIIPLGLSYYSFRAFHYAFERYRGTLESPTVAAYLSYMFFLPTLVVGPINRAGAFFDNRENNVWSQQTISYGLERILYGYAKITVLSGFVVNGLLRDYQASLEGYTVAQSYLEIAIDGLDLYFLFAGYSDIAIGFARLLGYRVMENFNWPFFQKNISEFWRCWHMSLSSWCRDYVYLPVVGYTRNPYLGTLATFVAIGLWHEISMRYILWGLSHGLGILIWRQYGNLRRRYKIKPFKHPLAKALYDGACVLLTVHYVWFALVLVSEPSLSASFKVYYIMFLGWWI